MSEFASLNDWELVSEQTNRKQAFEELFLRHRDYVFRLALSFSGKRWVADDVLQEVFIRLYRKSFGNEHRAEFTTYLYRFTLNVTREELRGYQLKKDAMALHDPWNSGDEERERKIKDIENALKVLSQKQREVLTLRFFEDKSVSETAEIIGCREGTVKSNLHWAITNLKKVLNSKKEK